MIDAIAALVQAPFVMFLLGILIACTVVLAVTNRK